MPTFVVGTAAGIAIAVITRQLLIAALTARLRHGVARLAQGDAGTLLAGYHENAVLHFHEGGHRWSASTAVATRSAGSSRTSSTPQLSARSRTSGSAARRGR